MGNRHDERLDALEELYRTRLDAFVRVARAIVGERERARDAVQDGFAQAVRSIDRHRGDGTLEAWVWQIVVNAARKEARRAGRVEPLAAEAGIDSHDDERGAVRAMIAGLAERQRQVVFLRYYADLDHAAIADALGIRVGTVAATLNHAHAAIRTRLEATQ